MKRALIAAALAALPLALQAHHGWSEYDQDKPLKLTGRVLESGYEHPHGSLRLETPGKVWHVVLAPPSRMDRRGVAREALVAGILVAVEGFPNRDKAEEMRAERITIAGKTAELR
jgi:hypothetical protein